MRAVFLFSVIFFVSPLISHASVSISEVAWMGNAVSANHEWIELYNDGDAVAVDGWVLSDGANLSIELAGTISANSYAVLERTSDDSALGAAFLIYAGALVNSGATLRLERADGTVVDQVSGGEDWDNVGGDNTTKETAQYTSSGWITAVATPGRPAPAIDNLVKEGLEDEDETVSTKETKKKEISNPGEPVRLEIPDVTLQLDIHSQSVGYVNQPISYSVEPSGIGEHLINSLSYQWNFGDGQSASGKEVSHVYSFPGKYVVTVYAGFKRQEQVSRHEITILPVALSITTSAHGDVQVNNDSPYEVDLSGYLVKGTKDFLFPPRTIILPNQTVTLHREKVGSDEHVMLAVYDTELKMVAAKIPEVIRKVRVDEEQGLASASIDTEPASAQLIVERVSVNYAGKSEGTKSFGFAQNADNGVKSEQTESVSLATTTTQMTSEESQTKDRPLAYLGLVVVLALGIIGLLALPKSDEKRSSL